MADLDRVMTRLGVAAAAFKRTIEDRDASHGGLASGLLQLKDVGADVSEALRSFPDEGHTLLRLMAEVLVSRAGTALERLYDGIADTPKMLDAGKAAAHPLAIAEELSRAYLSLGRGDASAH